MIALLHGYLLEGSGSNLWTRSVVRALCREGETVHLLCQENRPERYDFVSAAYVYAPSGERKTLLQRDTPYTGSCILHRPAIGDVLPVYVDDHYEDFSRVVPMVDLPDAEIEAYLEANTVVLRRIVHEYGISAMHANHAVLMSVVAQRVARSTSVPFAVMPHGSALEYAVKRDPRFHEMASGALREAGRIFAIGPEIQERLRKIFAGVPDVERKTVELNLGVDTRQFEPVDRDGRVESIRRLEQRLAGKTRGRTPAMSEAFLGRLDDDISLDALRSACAASARYSLKSPDAELERQLEAVDWETSPTLLFVGRLIASKGLVSVLAALPLILREHPGLRLFVTGHGPLREPMEAFLWALANGRRRLVENIVSWGTALEGSQPESFRAVRSFHGRLRENGSFDDYLDLARDGSISDRVIFTGYLEHPELRLLFACCDVAVFPSIVAEAGPLVFLEALACGCFPLGTYFGGMAASIDAVSASLSRQQADLMRIRPEEERTVGDIVSNAAAALRLDPASRRGLREAMVQRYDWRFVARKLRGELGSLADSARSAAEGQLG